MKPAWDKLMGEFESASSVVVADVDCTKEQDLCSKQGVQGYPTIKYWSAGEKKDYSGGRDFDSLKKHAESLEVKCDVKAPKDCDEKENKFITLRQSKDAEANKKEVERLTKMAAGNMKAELKQWLMKRLHILKQLV